MFRIVFCVLVCLCHAGECFARQDVRELIDQLVETSQAGMGFDVFGSGTEFLPYESSSEMSMLVVGAPDQSQANALRQIVSKGGDAVPDLLRHLTDDRKIKMEPLQGMMWMDYWDEYDFNKRTDTAPKGVNLEMDFSSKEYPISHSVTVGDLCFVALGQIVNRKFATARYQPTGGLVISSPTHSKKLSKVIREDWLALTKGKHRKKLIDDFRNPDSEERRIGAYTRLSFYYPEAVEPLVLDVLHSKSHSAGFIESLVHDDSKEIGDTVRKIYDEHADDDDLAPACLRCLANRGYDSLLVEALDKIDVSVLKIDLLNATDLLNLEVIYSTQLASGLSVQKKLREIFQTTSNYEYLLAVLRGFESRGQPKSEDGAAILNRITEFIKMMPANTEQGRELLDFVDRQFPDSSVDFFESFMKGGGASRAYTVIQVCSTREPAKIALLIGLLDDTRKLRGREGPVRVCDRAAEAICQSLPDTEFECIWPRLTKDRAIEKIKEILSSRNVRKGD